MDTGTHRVLPDFEDGLRRAPGEPSPLRSAADDVGCSSNSIGIRFWLPLRKGVRSRYSRTAQLNMCLRSERYRLMVAGRRVAAETNVSLATSPRSRDTCDVNRGSESRADHWHQPPVALDSTSESSTAGTPASLRLERPAPESTNSRGIRHARCAGPHERGHPLPFRSAA